MLIKKFLSHLMINGEKRTSEKLLLKSFKKIQKESVQQSKKIIQFSVLNSTPIFKIHRVSPSRKNKKKVYKEIPGFIKITSRRTSLAIKLLLKSIKKLPTKLTCKLKQEIFQSSKNEGLTVKYKNELQKRVLQKKKYFTYFRW